MPFDTEDKRGIVYVWIGSKADPEEAAVAENIFYRLYDRENFSLQVNKQTMQCTLYCLITSPLDPQ